MSLTEERFFNSEDPEERWWYGKKKKMFGASPPKRFPDRDMSEGKKIAHSDYLRKRETEEGRKKIDLHSAFKIKCIVCATS